VSTSLENLLRLLIQDVVISRALNKQSVSNPIINLTELRELSAVLAAELALAGVKL